ncbi:nucleoside deaminase [Candidatus Fermentibacteria bacterium]|nr:nucleoside deaminase [Candidatus Fermentibacteria bacterium]
MREAFREAECARREGEVPVGAVVVHDGLIVGRGHNQCESLCDPTAHAEIIALGAAGSALGSWRMPGATLYVTLEPCAMCAGAALLARVGTLVYGAVDPTMGACGSTIDVIAYARVAGRLTVRTGAMGEEVEALMRRFFSQMREEAKRRGAGAVERGGLENR